MISETNPESGTKTYQYNTDNQVINCKKWQPSVWITTSSRRCSAHRRFGGALISAFAAGALLLAAMGLFGVVSGSATRRLHELAVRLALGADHSRVLRLVLKKARCSSWRDC